VALLPLIAIVVAVVWQLAVAGHATAAAAAAARAAARAQALGDDPRTAARTRLPENLEHGLRVRASDDGTVEVSIPIPKILGVGLGRAKAKTRFESQAG
jgi:Flp pilus assembly protein TadG